MFLRNWILQKTMIIYNLYQDYMKKINYYYTKLIPSYNNDPYQYQIFENNDEIKMPTIEIDGNFARQHKKSNKIFRRFKKIYNEIGTYNHVKK